MRRTLTIVAAAALASCMLVPAAMAENQSPNPKQIANQICHDQKKGMDKRDFKQLYNGGKRAMQTCKRENRPEAETIVANVAQECDTYRDEQPEAFAAEYGDKKNAFGKCVSDRAKEQADEHAQNTATAAHECDTYRDGQPEAFSAEYGEGRNAFGKCVSDRASEEEEPAPAPTA